VRHTGGRDGEDIKVLVVDACLSTRVGLEELLQVVEGAKFAGEAEEATGALRLAAEIHPTFVVMDPELGSEIMDGVELCRDLKALPDPPRVVVYTMCNSPDEVAQMMLAGADFYIHKSAGEEELAEIWQAMCRGESVWFLGRRPEGRVGKPLNTDLLTPREKDVLGLLLKRYTNKEIAQKLHLTYQTVKNHVYHVLHKLGYRSRQELFQDLRI